MLIHTSDLERWFFLISLLDFLCVENYLVFQMNTHASEGINHQDNQLRIRHIISIADYKQQNKGRKIPPPWNKKVNFMFNILVF